jgi:hypothetical protein
MLGGRYGTIPEGKDLSITADEVHFGALSADAQGGPALFYFRQGAVTERMNLSCPGTFREPKHSANSNKLATLKRAIRRSYRPCLYRPSWDAEKQQLLNLKDFGDRVENDIIATINAEFGSEPTARPDDLAEEKAAMEAFVAERIQDFVLGSRDSVLSELLAHASATDGNNYVCLMGGPGSGKSTLLAFLSLHPAIKALPTSLIISHFVGASPASTDVRRTLHRLCREIYTQCDLDQNKREALARVTGDWEVAQKARRIVELEYAILDDPENLRRQFRRFLEMGARKKRIVILIDAAEQFDANWSLSGLIWLPDDLPANVRIIVSLLAQPGSASVGQGRDDGLPLSPAIPSSDGLVIHEHQMKESQAVNGLRRRRNPAREIELAPLNSVDAEAILDTFLARYRKRLGEKQRKALLAKDDSDTPLYLLTALEELRTLGNYDEITDRICQLPGQARSLFLWILNERLAHDPGFVDGDGRPIGEMTVHKVVSFMATSRHGLSQAELAAIVAPNDTAESPAPGPDALGNVAALLRLLRPYLMMRGDLLDFFHNQFREAVKETYLEDEPWRLAVNRALASHFRRYADPAGDNTWTAGDTRALGELPYHLTEAREWSTVHSVLTNLSFLGAKSHAGLVYDLLADYYRAEQLWTAHEQSSGRLVRVHSKAAKPAPREFNHDKSAPWAEPADAPADSSQLEEQARNRDGSPLLELRAWHRLVAHHAAEFGDSAIPAFQIAYNSAQSGPPADEMAARLSQGLMPNGYWLRRVNRPAWDGRSPCVHILEQHQRPVVGVVVGRDGHYGASVGGDHDVHLWDLRLGVPVNKLTGPSAPVSCMAATPDLERAVSGDVDGNVVVWDLTAGTLMRLWPGQTNRLISETGHTDVVNAVCITPDGQYVISGSDDQTIRVWDIGSGNCLRSVVCGSPSKEIEEFALETHLMPVNEAAADIAFGLLSPETRQRIRQHAKLFGSGFRIASLTASPDLRVAVAGGGGGLIKVVDLQQGTVTTCTSGKSA